MSYRGLLRHLREQRDKDRLIEDLNRSLDRVRAERNRLFDWMLGDRLSAGWGRDTAERMILYKMTDERHRFDGSILAALDKYDRERDERDEATREEQV